MQELKNTAVRYCPLTEELFASEEEKRAWYIKTWGYLPKALPITALPQPLLLQATQEVHQATHLDMYLQSKRGVVNTVRSSLERN